MATTFCKTNKVCGTCAHWQGQRTASVGGFASVETVSSECAVALVKQQKMSFQQGTCNAKGGQKLWELWGPLR